MMSNREKQLYDELYDVQAKINSIDSKVKELTKARDILWINELYTGSVDEKIQMIRKELYELIKEKGIINDELKLYKKD